jgi:hypothetical protein
MLKTINLCGVSLAGKIKIEHKNSIVITYYSLISRVETFRHPHPLLLTTFPETLLKCELPSEHR